MNYWFCTKWFLFTLCMAKIVQRFQIQNEVQDLLQINMKTSFADFLKRFKKLQVIYHPDSQNGDSQKYAMSNEYKQNYFNDMNTFKKNKQKLFFESDIFDSKLEVFQNNIKQISIYILKQIFIFYLIFQIDNNIFLFSQLIIYLGSLYFDVPILVNLIYYFLGLPMRLQTVERYYFFSSIFEKYPFMSRKNILDTILFIKISYFYISVFISKMIKKDRGEKYLRIFVENLHALKQLQNQNLPKEQQIQKIDEMRAKIDEVFPKPNRFLQLINKVFSFVVLILFLFQMGSSLF